MSVLITGATGCLGAEITRQLCAAGKTVTAQGRNRREGAALTEIGANFLALDLRDPRPFTPFLAGTETVFHCAALSSAWGRREDFEALNVTATRRLLKAAAEAGVKRFIFASSPSIYADGTDRLNLREDAPLPARFATHYARTKAQAEALALAADRPGAMRVVALRPRAIYGRGDRSLMPRLRAAMERGTLPLIAGGEALIDVTHVSDAARAMVLAARYADQAGGRAFNITSGEAWRFSDLASRAAAIFGLTPRRKHLPYGLAMAIATILETGHRVFRPSVEPILTRQAVASLGRSLTLDIAAAREVLHYHPQVTLDEGIRDYST
ncbi:NAD-dependent epimerase/dehydratase family protein [Xinfangfangia sp. D13-10-4-6]|uniref:NAD-dependent epimerase/dehydratase family protein n=1 Tax=Pseudogemmobacter hezensis TaxID=2737662 RepID=UPI0015525089|nr:NAD-dependent epimerase/dehydratase family protein [Pseudogemmobacter hezensis]NPD16547.1 NAD-dependent epimerase/dehydratase family protein [Pseudogemmobacter hezensis]